MISFFKSWKKYGEILGNNRRNQQYIRALNLSGAKKIADNKILTKQVLARQDIETPELFKIIRTKEQLNFIDWDSLPKSFVIKPNRGSTGNGIILIYGRSKNKLEWIRSNGKRIGVAELILHMERILEGQYSMGNARDKVIIEERIKNHSALKPYCYKGVPDVRIIVFNHVPIMAGLRLPTKRSDGKANVNAGGIYMGIDIASGITTTAVMRKQFSLLDYDYDIVEETIDLDQNLPLRGISIPYWNKILEISIKCQEATGLGFAGIDIAIDKDRGPVVLEANARAGLAIQVCNMTGLRPRLERVKGLNIRDAKHGIRVAKDLFGGEVEEEIEAISGKELVNLIEKVSVPHINTRKKKREQVNAFFNTSILGTRIDARLARRIGYLEGLRWVESLNIPETIEDGNEAVALVEKLSETPQMHPSITRFARISEEKGYSIKPVVSLTFRIAGVLREVEAIIIEDEEMLYPIHIGRRDMRNYLIDTGKTF